MSSARRTHCTARALCLAVALFLMSSGCGSSAVTRASSEPARSPGGAETSPSKGGSRRGLQNRATADRETDNRETENGEPNEHIVVRFDDRSLTRQDVEAELALEQISMRRYHATPAHHGELLENIITRELLADEARRRGYQNEPRVTDAARQLLAPLGFEALRAELDVPEPTDAELHALYDAERERFRRPARARARIMVIRDRSVAERVLAQLLARPPDDHRFIELAQEHGWNAPMLNSSGIVGPFERPVAGAISSAGVPAPLAEAVFEAPGGAIVPDPIEYRGVFYLARVLEKSPSSDLSFEDARPSLRELVLERSIERELDRRLFGESDIAFDEPALSTVLSAR